jgi:uncharacterized membrane protein
MTWWEGTMRVDVRTEIEIERPIQVVAEYAASPDNAPEWYVNIRSVEWITSPPVQRGSRMAFVAHFLGRVLRYTYEVTEYEAGRRLVMRTSEGPVPMETTYTWTESGAGRTRMTLRNRGEAKGFGAVVSPLLGLAMRRANRHDLRRLKRRLEEAAGREAGARPS